MEEIEKIADKASNIRELKEMVKNFFKGLESYKDGKDIIYKVDKKLGKDLLFGGFDGKEEDDENNGVKGEVKIMLIGEALGKDEGENRQLFFGIAGGKLNKLLKEYGLERTDMYIANMLFYEPIKKESKKVKYMIRRTIEIQNEINIYKPIIEKHIALVKPKLIVCLGKSASKLINNKDTVANMRLKKYEYKNKYLNDNIEMVVVYHPNAKIKDIKNKEKEDWEFIKKLSEKL